MANLVRTAKSGNDWSLNELLAYNIRVQAISPEEFFVQCGPNPPLDQLDPAILTSLVGDSHVGLSESSVRYLGYLDFATRATQDSFIVDFARETLHFLGFAERNLVLCTRYTTPLIICGEDNRTAQTDVCLLRHRPSLILLVLISDNMSNTTDAQSRVIADAIAAFQFNNRKRRELGFEPLKSMTIPCITMFGTRPTFYLVPVTLELSNAVATGQYPASETIVSKCVTVAGQSRRVSDGMDTAQYRQVALQRFLAFKALAKTHWEAIVAGLDI